MLWLRTSGRASKTVPSEAVVALAVRDEHLDGRPRRAAPDGGDGGGEPAGAAVGQVVAGHAGDHRVGQTHPLHGLGHPLGLAGVEGQGLAGVDQAEPAGPGAPRAVDHEGGGPVGPALVDVGAAGLLAHRDQIEVAEAVLEAEVVVAHAGLDPQPGRLALPHRRPRRRDRRPTAGAGRARRLERAGGPPPVGRRGGRGAARPPVGSTRAARRRRHPLDVGRPAPHDRPRPRR